MAEIRVVLTGIREQGRHGVDPGEQLEPQEFVVDLDVIVFADGDSLEETVDYRVLADTARRTVGTTSFQLLETLADAVARAVFEWPNVEKVTAIVHKPGAAASLQVDDVRAEATVA